MLPSGAFWYANKIGAFCLDLQVHSRVACKLIEQPLVINQSQCGVSQTLQKVASIQSDCRLQFTVHLHMNIEQQWKAIKYWAIVEEQLSQVATQPVQHNSPTIRPLPNGRTQCCMSTYIFDIVHNYYNSAQPTCLSYTQPISFMIQAIQPGSVGPISNHQYLLGKRTSQPGRARPSTTCRSSTPAKIFHKCEKLITTGKGGLLMSHRRMMISFFSFVDEELKNLFLFHDSQPVRIVDH